MRMPPAYIQEGKLIKLNRAMYALHRSPLLWKQKLIDEINKLGVKQISHEPHGVQQNAIICFLYIHNIVFVLKNDERNKVEKTVASLSKLLIIERKREL